MSCARSCARETCLWCTGVFRIRLESELFESLYSCVPLVSPASMRCSERQDRWYIFEDHTEWRICSDPVRRLSRSGALTSACSVVFFPFQLCDCPQCCCLVCDSLHDVSCIGSSQIVIRTVLLAFVTHFLNSLLPFFFFFQFPPLPCTFHRVFGLHSPNFLIHQLAGFIGTWFVCPSSLWRCLASKSMQRRGVVSWS